MTAEPGVRRVTVVLVRHGESIWNAEEIVQGQHGPGLTDLGAEQARVTAELLARDYPDAVLLARSDLPRVEETAAPAEEAFGVPVRVDPRFRELDMGSWSGLRWPEVAERDPEGVRRWRRGEDIPRGGGETYARMRVRVWDAVDDVAESCRAGHDGDACALVFTHGGPIRVAVAGALDLPEGGWRSVAPVDNASLTVLEAVYRDGHPSPNGRARWALRAYNRVGHLTPASLATAFTDA